MYTAFAALYFPVAVHFIAVAVELEVNMRGMEGVVVDLEGMAGAEVANPLPGGFDE